MACWGRAGHGKRHCHNLAGDDVVVSVDQPDRHLVLARGHPADVDRVVVAGVRPPPWEVVDDDVEMANTWGYAQSARTENRCDANVFGAILGLEHAELERLGLTCARGRFGAEMKVSLVNDGPVTLILDSDELQRPRRA